MHHVYTETHLGTHVEVSSHLNFDKSQLFGREGGMHCAEFPLETWLGPCCVLDFTHKQPINGQGQGISADDCAPVQDRDIVLMRSPYRGPEQPYLTAEAQQALIAKRIKQWGFQGVSWERSQTVTMSFNSITFPSLKASSILIVSSNPGSSISGLF